MLDELFKEALRSKKEICVPLSKELIEEVMDLVKQGELRPTLLANPLKSRINLYKPLGEGRIHVRITKDSLCVHYDKRDPARDPLGHLIADTEARYGLIVIALAILAALLKKLQKGRG